MGLIMDVLAFAGRVLLVLVFAVAAVGKLVDREAARRALADFRVPRRLVPSISWLLPAGELTVSICLLIQPIGRYAAVAAAVLLVLFMSGIAAAMARGEAPECNCFGQIGSAPAGKGTLVRNTVLGAVAVLVALYGAGLDPGAWFEPRTSAEIAVLILFVMAVTLAAAIAGLYNDRRSLSESLAEARSALSHFPPGLPIGATAPAFSLQSADGQMVTLADLLATGRPVALMFVSPSCRPCHYMFPDISRWQQTLSDRLTITLIAHGSIDETREMSAKYGLTNLLSDPKAGVFREYRGQGTPSMVTITPDGKVGIRIRSSHGAVEAALRRALHDAPAPDVYDNRDAGRPLIEVERAGPGRDTQPA